MTRCVLATKGGRFDGKGTNSCLDLPRSEAFYKRYQGYPQRYTHEGGVVMKNIIKRIHPRLVWYEDYVQYTLEGSGLV